MMMGIEACKIETKTVSILSFFHRSCYVPTGNALRHVLICNQDVEFAGYSVPHPSEPIVQLRVQTIKPTISTSPPTRERRPQTQPTAVDTLKVACQTLHDQCDIVLEKLEDLFPEAKEDRIRMEEILLQEEEEEGYDDDDQPMEE